MTTRRARLIAKLVWWAAGAPEVALAAALVVVGEPSFTQPSLVWSYRWKRLARLLRERNADLKQELLDEKEERECTSNSTKVHVDTKNASD